MATAIAHAGSAALGTAPGRRQPGLRLGAPPRPPAAPRRSRARLAARADSAKAATGLAALQHAAATAPDSVPWVRATVVENRCV